MIVSTLRINRFVAFYFVAVSAVYADLQSHSLLHAVVLPCSFVVGTFFLFRLGPAILFLVGFLGMYLWAADDAELLENILIPILLWVLGAGLFFRWLLSEDWPSTMIRFQFFQVSSSHTGQSQGTEEEHRYRYRHYYEHEQAHKAEASHVICPLDEAYLLLGAKPEMTSREVKKAYQRLLSANHPDKLMSQGLSAEELSQANKKTQMIRAAYERIEKARKYQES